MFTKKKLVSDSSVRCQRYKKVVDWDAVFGAIFIGAVVISILAALFD
ncbi:hypothetical protein [Thalassospira alkalitolerans]|nr:hypothetical protein [Thalassospira alkalitolerans]